VSAVLRPAPDAAPKLESVHAHFEAQIREFDHELVAYLQRFEGPAAAHYAMIQYHFGYADAKLQRLQPGQFLARGKRLRPILCMLFCRMFKLSPEIAKITMMATEVMHSASLAHDDIQDKDAVRWGRPTAQNLFGQEQAINVGDALIGMVYQILLGLRAHGVDPNALLAVIETFNRTHMNMCEGQHLDLTYKWYQDVSVEQYLAMIDRKTASPCVCVAEAISVLADCPAETRAALVRFGHCLGMLYQICDDIRGIWCEPEALGRQIGQDICQERASLPLLYAFKRGSGELKRLLRERLADGRALTPEEIARVQADLHDCGAYKLCHRDADGFYNGALEALDALDREGPELAVLRGILGTCYASVDFRR
jgi:geranylgeranyl pyrophosphate synthase